MVRFGHLQFRIYTPTAPELKGGGSPCDEKRTLLRTGNVTFIPGFELRWPGDKAHRKLPVYGGMDM